MPTIRINNNMQLKDEQDIFNENCLSLVNILINKLNLSRDEDIIKQYNILNELHKKILENKNRRVL